MEGVGKGFDHLQKAGGDIVAWESLLRTGFTMVSGAHNSRGCHSLWELCRRMWEPRGVSRSNRVALDALIAEATVDCYNDSECVMGFHAMIEEHLAVPFQTVVLGVDVTVTGVDLTDDEQIVAVCVRGKSKQRIPVLDLPLPAPPLEGTQWLDAYRRWARGT